MERSNLVILVRIYLVDFLVAMGIFPKISLVDKTFITERALLLMVLEEEEIISLVDEVSEILTNHNVNCVVCNASIGLTNHFKSLRNRSKEHH